MSYNSDTLLRAAVLGDKESLEQFLSSNTGLVKKIALRFYNRGYEPEEIIQLGMIGLFKAVKNFDFSYGVQFSTYAVPLITGEIKRFLRDNGYIKVSRSTRELAVKINEVSESYEKKFGSSPSVSELSKLTGYSSEDIIFALNSSESVSSLDSLINDEKNSERILKIRDEKADFEEKTINRINLSRIIGTLKPKERQVLTFRYFSNLTQKQTAEKLGVSQVQISRIEKNVLDKIRKMM